MLTGNVSCIACEPSIRCRTLGCLLAVLIGSFAIPHCAAQGQYRGIPPEGAWHPLHHNAPPGQAAGWLNAINRYDPTWLQPVRVELPTDGTVSVYSASQRPEAELAPPAQFSVSVGHVYRLRVADMPEFPGLEVYPTIELLDRLHPPLDRINDFPIPVVISEEDLRIALAGQLVTRVIYLEQPQLAAPLDPLRRDFPQSVDSDGNALLEADRRGRPMMILRIGSRTPTPGQTSPSFYGTGGTVDASYSLAAPEQSVTVREKSNTRQNFTVARNQTVRTVNQ
jgi:hypothetical protein